MFTDSSLVPFKRYMCDVYVFHFLSPTKHKQSAVKPWANF